MGGAKDDLAEIRPWEQTTTLPFFAASSFHTARLAEGKRIRPTGAGTTTLLVLGRLV